eukprot:4849204-Alexandrium_andersonii.AAC.1
MAQPEGGAGGRELTEAERVGNEAAAFAAELFKEVLEAGKFALVGNPAPSGRYPKLWSLPAWQQLLQRPGAEVTPWCFCAWGLGLPGSATERYRKRTWG